MSLIALGQESFTAANKEQLIVSVLRGMESVRPYTDDKAAMMDAIQRSAARLSATELIGTEPPRRKSSFTQRLIRNRFIQRAYTALRERMATYSQPIHYPQREGPSLEH